MFQQLNGFGRWSGRMRIQKVTPAPALLWNEFPRLVIAAGRTDDVTLSEVANLAVDALDGVGRRNCRRWETKKKFRRGMLFRGP